MSLEFHRNLYLELRSHRKQKKTEIVCNKLIDRMFTFEEEEALLNEFRKNKRKMLTNEQVTTVLFSVALDPESYELDIPF